MNRIIGLALVVFILYYLVSSPAGAAGLLHSALDVLRHAGNDLSRFVDRL